MLFNILALLVAPALGFPAADGPIHIPLVRHDPAVLKRMNSAYQQPVDGVELDSGLGLSYPLKLGSPGQHLDVLVSLGSGSGLTIFGDDCDDTPFFKPKKSSTFEHCESIGGPFDLAKETVCLAGQTLTYTPFAYADAQHAPTDFGNKTGQTGMLSFGLGLNAHEKVGPILPALASAWKEPVIGVYLAPSNAGSSGLGKRAPGFSGQISAGGTDGSKYQGFMNNLKTLDSNTWNTAARMAIAGQEMVTNSYVQGARNDMQAAQTPWVRSLTTGKTKLSPRDNDKRIFVRPEIGTEQILVAPYIADQMFKCIPGAQKVELSQGDGDAAAAAADIQSFTGLPAAPRYRYSVPCNTNATIGFTFNDITYDMSPSVWVIPNPIRSGSSPVDTRLCKTHVTVPHTENFGDEFFDVLLGTTFLQTVYTVFTYDPVQPQLGFYKLADNIPAPSAAPSASHAQAAGGSAMAPATTATETSSSESPSGEAAKSTNQSSGAGHKVAAGIAAAVALVVLAL